MILKFVDVFGDAEFVWNSVGCAGAAGTSCGMSFAVEESPSGLILDEIIKLR